MLDVSSISRNTEAVAAGKLGGEPRDLMAEPMMEWYGTSGKPNLESKLLPPFEPRFPSFDAKFLARLPSLRAMAKIPVHRSSTIFVASSWSPPKPQVARVIFIVGRTAVVRGAGACRRFLTRAPT